MMETRRSFLVLLLAGVAVACAVAAAPAAAMPGRTGPIPDVGAPHIQQLGRWAVAEHDKEASDALSFLRVVAGEQQAVAGMNYRLVLEARGPESDGATYGTYVARVFEQRWSSTLRLDAFVPVPDT